MPFVYNKNNEYNDCNKFKHILYSDYNLNFLFIFDKYNNNFVFYKSKIEDTYAYGIKEHIVNLLNNYYKIKNNYASSYKSYYLSHHIKFLNYNEIIEKLLSQYTNYDPDILGVDVDLYYNYNKEMKLDTHIYNFEYNSGLRIESELEKQKLLLNSDERDQLSFEDYIKKITSNFIIRMKSILDQAFNTDFKKIESYLHYLCLEDMTERDFGNGILLNYKNFKISLPELTKFNKMEIEFDDIVTVGINNKEDYDAFINMISTIKNSLNLRYISYKFNIENSGYSDNPSLTMHVPLLSEYISYKNLDVVSNYTLNSLYSYRNTKLFIKIIKLYFYLFKKNNVFDKFKDAFEKLVLK